ncbi:MAG: GNAT family N-acetyltransferase [Thermoplasmata archaeon]|nr:GNAT family N-acetyltransferase [Thermoplasmata archaeon]
MECATSPSETRRLLTEWAQTSAPRGEPWSPDLLNWAVGTLDSGLFAGRLWVGPKDDAVGIALGTLPGEVGGRIEVAFLADGYRHPSSLDAFLARLDSPGAFGPLLELPEPPSPEGFAPVEAAFRARGFVPIVRMDMRYPAERPPPSAPADPAVRVRNIVPTDVETIARLTARAYADNPVDVALFRRYRDPLEDARWGTEAILGDLVGEWLPFASFLAEDDEGPVAATLANELHGPLITQVMVDPRARGRGHATRLLGATVGALRAAGRGVPRLVVTRANRRAHRLYEHIGFVPDPSAVGARWLHSARLGLASADLADA